MAASITKRIRKIPSLHNFRPVQLQNCEIPEGEKSFVYRSSRPDFLKKEEVEDFKLLGIKCIIDLRSEYDFNKANGQKLLQTCGHFTSQVVKFPKGRNYRPGESVQFYAVGEKHTGVRNDILSNQWEGNDRDCKHYLINFFTSEYVKTIVRRAPWYIKLLSIFVLLFDLVFRTGWSNFVRVYAKNVINPAGLISAYIDMVEMSQKSICAALKILSKKENIPALINCAHGKDRTGIVSAMVLSVIGESKDNIIADYHRSEEGLEPVKQRLYEEVVKKYSWDWSFMRASPQTMEKLLDYITDKYGSVTDYLEYIGFGAAEQEQLRRNLGHSTAE